jgi:hypothetical protein
MLLEIQNPTNIVQEKTTLSAQLASGASSLTVRNSEGITSNNYIIIGKLGEETTELERVSSVPSATSLSTVSTVSFAHGIGTPISVIGFNQVEISRKTSASGTYSVLTTIDLEVDDTHTTYDDTAGQTTYYYRTRFYNSTSGQFSDYSPELKGSGFSSRAVKPMIDTVLRRLRDPKGEYNSREDVLQELIYEYEEVTSKLIQSSSEYYRKEVEIPVEKYKYEYTLPDDFREIKEVYNGDGTLVDPLPHNIAGTTGVPGYELTDRDRIYFNDVPTPSTDDVSPVNVHRMDSITADGTWAVGDDGENLTVDTDEFKEGTGSLNFDVDVSDSANNSVTLTNSTMTAQDLDDYEDTGKWRVWFYFPDVTYITSVDFRWGSSSTVYWALNVTKDYKDYAFHDGWNFLEFDWSSDDLTETGSPVTADAGAIDYLFFRINYSASQPDDTDFRIDGLRLTNTWHGNDVYRVVFFRQPDMLVNEMDELDIPPGNSRLLVDGAVAALMVGYENRDTISRTLLQRSDDKKSMFINQSSKRTRRPIGPRPYGRGRGYSSSSGFRRVNKNYDVFFP